VSQVGYETDGPVATVTLNRPERLNAFTETMLGELLAAFDRADADDNVRAVIVTGAGRGFCAGSDLASSGVPSDDLVDGVPRDRGGQLTLRLAAMRQPVIAAINGPAVGVGITMTLAMDVRLASTEARIGFVFARRGLVPEAASSWFLPRIVGIAQALEWVCTAELISAEDALAGRLVSRVLPPPDLLPAARELALRMADGTSPVAIAIARRQLWGMLGAAGPADAHRLDSIANDHLRRGGDVAEGVASFQEKRPPRFPMTVSRDLPEHALPAWP
jgi:enoyl-CoA hydratase/carnithine racemase